MNKERLKTDWTPMLGKQYYTPDYHYSEWMAMIATNENTHEDKRTIGKNEAFKNKSECKEYMNSKGWINNGKDWKLDNQP